MIKTLAIILMTVTTVAAYAVKNMRAKKTPLPQQTGKSNQTQKQTTQKIRA